jgi:hypothetical protein
MATKIRDVMFQVKVKDSTSEGLNQVKQNVKQSSQEAGAAMSTLVPEKTGKALTRLNEKTEKARQLTTAFGGALGQTAGSFVFYGGTVASVVGGFNRFELGAIAGTAAVVALGAAIIKMVTGPLSDATKKLAEARKALQSTSDEWDRATQAIFDAAAGLDEWDIKRREFSSKQLALNDQIANTRRQMDMMKNSAGGAIRFFSGVAVESTEAWQILENTLRASQKELDAVDEKLSTGLATARAVKERKEADDKAEAERIKRREDRFRRRKALREKEENDLIRRLQRGVELDEQIGRKQEEDARRRFLAGQQEDARIIAQQDETNRRLHESNLQAFLQGNILDEKIGEQQKRAADRKIQEEKRAAEASAQAIIDAERRKQAAIQKSIQLAATVGDTAVQMAGMFDLFGEASAKSEEEKAKAESKRLAVVNAIQAATQIASGVAAIAAGQPFAAATHFLAATLYSAAAIKAGISAGGGGGAGGAAVGTATERARFREGGAPTEAETAEEQARGAIVINVFGHQVFGSDSGRFFDREIQQFRDHQFPGADSERF